jgi:glycosyltransferase involved in cell wall biosynthesis
MGRINPLVSVILPVYNAGEYLKEAVFSILNQTFTDFELILINDGSTDGCLNFLEEIVDTRIKRYDNPSNLGLIATLNRGIELSNGEFIARMDADDIAFPDRFSEQINVLKNCPEIGVVGCWIQRFGFKDDIFELPVNDAEIKTSLFFFCPLSHPAVILRKCLLIDNNIRYDERFLDAEDYQLWFQLVKVAKFYNIPKVLLKYRIHENQKFFTDAKPSQDSVLRIKKEGLDLFGIEFTDLEREIWVTILNLSPRLDYATILLIEKVVNANRMVKVFDTYLFERKLLVFWKNSFMESQSLPLTAALLLFKSYLRPKASFTIKQYIRIFTRFLNV